MSRFAIRNLYFIVVVCLIIAMVGFTTPLRPPVDMFACVNIPEVGCTTTLGRIDHIDSAFSTLSNLAVAQLRRLPHNPPSPVLLKFDALALPVFLVLLNGRPANFYATLMSVVMLATITTSTGIWIGRYARGSKSYAIFTRALFGGISVPGLCTVYVAPAPFSPAYWNHPIRPESSK